MPYTPTTLNMDHFDYMQHVSLALISVKDSKALDQYFSQTFAYADEFIDYDKSTRGVVGAGLALTRFCKAITDMSNSTASYACEIIESNGISHEDAFNAVKRLYPNETAESWWAKYSTGQIQSFQTYSDLQLAYPFEFEKTRQEIMAGLGARCIEQAVALVGASEPASFIDYGTLANDIINSHSSSSNPADLAEQYLKAASRYLVKNDDLGMTQDTLDELIAQAKALLNAEQIATDFTLTESFLSRQTYWYENITDQNNKVVGQRKYSFSTSGGRHSGTIHSEYNDSTRNNYIDFAWIVDDGGQLWLKTDDDTEKSLWQVVKVYDNDTEKLKIVLRKRYTLETMTLSNYSSWTREISGQLTFVGRVNAGYSVDFIPWSIPWTITLHARSFSDEWSDEEITDNSLDVCSVNLLLDAFSGDILKTLSVENGKINVNHDGITMSCAFDSLTNSGSGTFTFNTVYSKEFNTIESIVKEFSIHDSDVRLNLSQSIEASGTANITYNKSNKQYAVEFVTREGKFRSWGKAVNYYVWDIPAGSAHFEGEVDYNCEGTVSFSRTLYYK